MFKQGGQLKPVKFTEKTITVIVLGLLAVVILAAVCYELVGPSIVRAAYDGRSIQVLNDAIKFQDTKPVEHYLDLADSIFYKGLFIGISGLAYVYIITRLTFFDRAPNPAWIILWGLFIIFGIYMLNPDFRIYSFHGLFHSGIVYEIMHGNIPPQCPMLDGQMLLWPWGFHFLAAGIAVLLNVSPPWAFAIINMLSFIGISLLIYKVSNLLIKDTRANLFSMVIAIFCSSYFVKSLSYWFRDFSSVHPSFSDIYISFKGVPVFEKMLNVNAVPLGLFFYIACVYVLLRIFSDREKWRYYLPLLLLTVVGVGFFYLQMLPGLLGGFAILFTVKSLQYLRDKNKTSLTKIILTLMMVISGSLIVLPYIKSLTTDVGGKIGILNPLFMWQDGMNLLLIALPLLIIIFANYSELKKHFSQSMMNLLSLIAGAACTYICIRFPHNNDYKFLIQTMTLAGIIGGICISFMCRGKKGIIVILLMFILACPFSAYAKMVLMKNYNAQRLRESGTRLVAEGEEAELYDWILNNTARDDIFIDTKLSIPCMAQRRLFIAMDEIVDGKRVLVPGYGMTAHLLFTDTSGYSLELLEYRWRVVGKLYDPQVKMDDEELRELFSSNNNLLIVIRQPELLEKFNAESFDIAFRSSGDAIAVLRSK